VQGGKVNGFLEGRVQDLGFVFEEGGAEEVGPGALRVGCLLQGAIWPGAERTLCCTRATSIGSI